MDYKPTIIFANTSQERDRLRDLVSVNTSSVLCFEKETICFDNIRSIDPQAIVARTDYPSVAWRFLFALHFLKAETSLILLSDKMDDGSFDLYGLDVSLTCMPLYNGGNGFGNNLNRLISNNQGKKIKKAKKHLLVGETESIRRINAMLPNLQQTADSILITGESGTGKELLARMIANSSLRNDIIIKIDCAVLRLESDQTACKMDSVINGRFIESFHRIPVGRRAVTVLLDKIDHLDHEAQNDILYLLENQLAGRANTADTPIRYISTSETDLQELVGSGSFRKDLFYRLSAIPIHLPPLKSRLNDIPLLIDYFSIAACTRMGKSYILPKSKTMEKLCAYNWPGNIDEIEQLLLRYVSEGDEQLLLKDARIAKKKAAPTQLLYQTMQEVTEPTVLEIKNCINVLGDQPLKRICDKFAGRTEKKLMQKALEATNWNRKKAAALLNISYKSMLNKMKIYEISVN